MKEWLDFGSEYDIFTQRTSEMNSSVVFIVKTDAVTAVKAETSVLQTEVKEENKVKTWFKNLFSQKNRSPNN